MSATAREGLWGLLAEFETPGELVHAARAAREAGFRRVEAYTPYPIEELTEVLEERSRLPLIVLLGGLSGGLGGWYLQYWVCTIAYPLNIGGRPYNSWPSFIPVIFELTVLGASLAAFFGLLALNRLPMPYHPLFNVDRFAQASRDRYFLAIHAADERFDATRTADFLRSLGPIEVSDVAR